jgi:tetratricopeptide (TPR) repeat protein
VRTAAELNLLPELRDEQDRLTVHPLIAVWLAEKDGGPAVLDRMTDWFVARLPQPMRDDPRGRPWVEIQQESIALLDWLERVPAVRMPEVLRAGDEFAGYCGPYPVWIELCDREFRQELSPVDRSIVLRVLSWVCLNAGDVTRALIVAEEKLQLDRSRNDHREIGEAAETIGDVHAAQGRLDDALRIWREVVLPAWETVDYELGRAVTQGKIADVLQARGELDEALRIRREEELPVYERLGDVREKAACWGRVADVLQARGELNEALRIRREEELPVYERLGATRDLLVGQAKLALNLLERNALGDRDEAVELLRQAHAAAEKMGIPEADQIRVFMDDAGF